MKGAACSYFWDVTNLWPHADVCSGACHMQGNDSLLAHLCLLSSLLGTKPSRDPCPQNAKYRFELRCFLKIYFVAASPKDTECPTSFLLCVCVLPLSCAWPFVTPWTIAHQTPQPMGFSRQEYCGGLTCAFPGDRPDPRIEPWSSALQAGSLLSEPPQKPSCCTPS